MKNWRYFLFISFIVIRIHGQAPTKVNGQSFFIMPEVLVGKTMEANTDFPKTELQRSVFLSIGNYKVKEGSEWIRKLGYPKTGVTLGVTDFGNREQVGLAYTLMPFVEIGLFRKSSSRWNLNTGFGAAYLDTQFDPDSNSFNRGVSTKINWSFKSFFHYDVVKRKAMNWRLGVGYAHFSNGHARLPNQGFNSFLVSLSSVIGKGEQIVEEKRTNEYVKKRRLYESYLSFRTGIGQNVLSRIFNDKKEVYSGVISGGTIIDNTFRLGAGVYYRFYEHYYDHIVHDRQLINEQVPHFREAPYRYATNLGFFVEGELLMGHVGVLANLGVNVHKPFYKIDWQLSQGEFFNNQYTKLGELNWYYKVKRTLTSRLGIRYYLLSTSKSPMNNIFFGASLNANLGQADFSEFSLGYIYRFKAKNKKE